MGICLRKSMKNLISVSFWKERKEFFRDTFDYVR